nr:SH3 domain-containing protein [Anaerolineae bacterium]
TLIYPNPVFRNWLIARIEIYGPDIYSEDLEGYIPVYRENLFILWNFETGESIVLNGFFEFTGDFGTAWSEDGQRVFIGTLDPITRQNYIETFHVDVLTELTGIQHVYSTPISSRQTLLEGFGSSDLLLIYEVLEDKQTLISISDVTNDKYKSRPFINQVGTFSDFHLAESEERRRELSCLFDQTLPAQVSVGGFAQVASSAVALRAGAAITDDVLVTLTTGTGFEVIRAPECRDGYRWWPVRLPDGTEGFVAEASTDEYFIAPVSPAP